MPTPTHGSTLALLPAVVPAIALAVAGPASASQDAPPAESASEEVARLASETAPEVPELTDEAIFGTRGYRAYAITLESGFAGDAITVGPRASLHYFLADRFEIIGSVGVWGHFQDGTDAISVNPSIGFRYHFVTRETHSIYADLGVGLLLSNEEVPEGGTRTNFTPRAGFGATFPVGDDGARLDLGVRWHHVSNASTSGIDDNPDRDGIGVYAGLMIPF